MKKRFFLLLILSFFASPYIFGQNKQIISGNKKVIPLIGQSRLTQTISFEGKEVPTVQLTHIQTKPLSQLPKGVVAENEFTPDVFVGTEKKQRKLILQIPIYKKSGNKIEQLVSYDLAVDSEKTPSGINPIRERPTGITHSVLATGTWYKISVPSRGIFKIDYNFLQSLGLDPGQINPNNIRIYGNGGAPMSETVGDQQPDDLIENAILVKASGNTFQQGDYVLFYANGPVLWTEDAVNKKFTHTNNAYEDKSYYFLNFDLGPGLRVGIQNADTLASGPITYFDDYRVYDRDSVNIQKVGRTWWSNVMSSQTGMPSSTQISMNLGGIKDTVYAEVHVGNVNTGSGNNLTMKINGNQIASFSLGKTDVSNYYADQFADLTFTTNTPNLSFLFNYTPTGIGSAYIDYIELNYQRPLKFSGNQLNFRSWKALSVNGPAAFSIGNAPSGLTVWDITNPLKPTALSGTYSSNQYKFGQSQNGILHEYLAFTGNSFSNPNFEGMVENQDLHGLPETNLLIITNDSLLPIAEQFADFHRERDHILVNVASVQKIYNEFSSGSQDIGGIRNFIKMFYDREQNSTDSLQNVLLMGAASYDYKDKISANNTNLVPTYETVSGKDENSGFSTDDFFAILDNGEKIGSANSLLDVGIGRIPALTQQEASEVLNKIKNYISPNSFGPWKNVVSFVADDHDPLSTGGFPGMNHMNDCENISSYFYNTDRIYNLYKIYADAFHMVAEAGGARYPDVNEAIDSRIFNGTFLMAYSGHGDANRWAHEAILTPSDYDAWTNINRLPIMFTGTCDFGRFDDPDVRYAGVKMMMNPNGGVISIITTTQAVYQSGNTALSNSYMQHQFGDRDVNGNFLLPGEAMRRSKNDISGQNSSKYVMLGDPALRLPIPEYNVNTDTIFTDSLGIEVSNDTMKALGSYTINGSVRDHAGIVQNGFNGTVYLSIFDKPTTMHTVNTIPGTTPTYKVQNSIIAKSSASVVNGRFSASFVIPKDINYDLGKGKISYYANSDVKEAAGLDTNVTVGGFNPTAEADDLPPVVKPFIDNDKFRDGGVTGPDPVLFVELSDDHGINVSGGAPGHDLIAVLDGDIQHPFIMNDYYQTNPGDFRSGTVKFPLNNLPEGQHSLWVRAWDTYNNSGEGTVNFVVRNKDKGFISNIYNYPNPVTDQTHFIFQHNQSGQEMTVSLRIYNSYGALVWAIQKDMMPDGNTSQIDWDGNGQDEQPLARGIYFYKINIKTAAGAKASASQKLLLMKP